MTHGQRLFGRLSDEGAHSQCLQTVLSEKSKRPAEKFDFGAKRGRGTREEGV